MGVIFPTTQRRADRHACDRQPSTRTFGVRVALGHHRHCNTCLITCPPRRRARTSCIRSAGPISPFRSRRPPNTLNAIDGSAAAAVRNLPGWAARVPDGRSDVLAEGVGLNRHTRGPATFVWALRWVLPDPDRLGCSGLAELGYGVTLPTRRRRRRRDRPLLGESPRRADHPHRAVRAHHPECLLSSIDGRVPPLSSSASRWPSHTPKPYIAPRRCSATPRPRFSVAACRGIG